jgi:peptidoglycan/LPS O-acetylase OafA/YrhL
VIRATGGYRLVRGNVERARSPAPGVFMKIVRIPGLRFVAAMMVLIGHGLYAAHFAADTILDPLPSMGMALFFLLSGFVMWPQLGRHV